MKVYVSVVFISFFISLNLFAQSLSESDLSLLRNYEKELKGLAEQIRTDSMEMGRFAACHEFIPRLVKALKTKNSFEYPFSDLTTISFQYPEDSSFRIITWQLYVNPSEYRYYGAIQMNKQDLKLYPLKDRSYEITEAHNKALNANQWYGVLYYNIKTIPSKEKNYYALLGFDTNNFFSRRKVLDILHFDQKSGVPLFGAPIIEKRKADQNLHGDIHRMILEYTAEAAITLNYSDMMDMIVFDHLIKVTSPYKGQGVISAPDGSYEGYKIVDGKLKYVDKLFHETQEEPPSLEDSPLQKREDGIISPENAKKQGVRP